jgi:hypothetical protein
LYKNLLFEAIIFSLLVNAYQEQANKMLKRSGFIATTSQIFFLNQIQQNEKAFYALFIQIN